MLTSRGLQVAIDPLLAKQLTVRPEVNKDYCFDGNPSYKVYGLSKSFMYIPRNFPYRCEGVEIENKIPSGITCQHMQFVGKLKESTNQIEASNTVVSKLVDESNATQRQYSGNALHCGILSLPTGYGKTTVALHIMCRLGYKTLIIVHKEFLMNQWVERISQFVPAARIGCIQGPKVDVAHKDVVIGMLQSLSSKDYDRNMFREFGLTIVDETHHICTRMFSKSLMKYNTKYLLGLSATIERKDGLTNVLHWLMGPVLYQTHRSQKRDVMVTKCVYDCEDYKNEFPLNRTGKANMPQAINQLAESEDRNRFIVSLVRKCIDAQRKVLVLTDRRQHCMNLLEMCTEITIGGLYIGGMKAEELAESETKSLIIGTFTLAHEGLDIPALDTLILSTPKSYIVQAVGRILRETPGKTNHPLVMDVVDHWGPFKGQYYKRQKYYKSTGFTIRTHLRKEEDVDTDSENNREDTPFSFVEDD
jgi:superfamily II DNA or RNA helicase